MADISTDPTNVNQSVESEKPVITPERMINNLASEFGCGQIRKERVFIEAATRMGVSDPRGFGERDYRAHLKKPEEPLPYYMREEHRKAFGF